MKGSDNPFPSVILEEVATDGSATGTPAADHRRLFLGEDGALHLKDSASAVTNVAPTESLPVTIIDAKGDLIVGSGADTAARLPTAADGASLRTKTAASTGLEWQLNSLGNAVAPAVTDDSNDGYSVGSRWIDTTADKEYVCLDATVGAAVWVETTGGGGGVTVEDEGTPLSTVADTLDFVGAGVVASGTGTTKTITISGAAASASPLDSYLLTSGNSRNDEFAGGPTIDGKWTLLGTTPDVVDVNSSYSGQLYLRRNDTAALLTVYYQDLPTLPCDIYLKVTADTAVANYARGGGILLLPATPTTGSKGWYLGIVYNSNAGRTTSGIIYADLSTYGSQPLAGTGTPFATWLRITVLSGGTTADIYYSVNGTFWTLALAATALGFTAANAGIALAPEGQAADLLAAFDAYRVS